MIDHFTGAYRFLSNFEEEPVEYGGLTFCCSEGAYQAAKSLDLEIRKTFQNLDGRSARNAGQAGRLFLRADWEEVKLRIMSEIIHAKFSQSRRLRKLLLDTGEEELIEGNRWHDTCFGVCDGVGKNWLGRILMAERAYWRELSRCSSVGRAADL